MSLNKIIAGSLVAVSAVLSADAFAENWKENKIEYNCNYGVACPLQSEQYNPNSLPKTLQKVSRPGYKFEGWSLVTRRCDKKGDSGEVAAAILTGGIAAGVDGTKKAVFSKATSGTNIMSLPSKMNGGWFKYEGDGTDHNASKCNDYYSKSDKVVGKYKATAMWTLIDYHTVLELDGGYLSGDTSKWKYDSGKKQYYRDYNINDGGFVLPTPQKMNFEFLGWCTDKQLKSCSNTVHLNYNTPGNTDTTANKTYYVKWGVKMSNQTLDTGKEVQKPGYQLKIKQAVLNNRDEATDKLDDDAKKVISSGVGKGVKVR